MEPREPTQTAPSVVDATTGGLTGWLGLAADPEPERVAGYRIEGKLGQGGMGVVFKAVHPDLKRTAAVKRLLSGTHAQERERVRFLAEAEAMAAVKHPHVVTVYDFGTADGQPYLAMEYLDGGTLAGKLENAATLPTAGAADLVAKIADGVQAAHDQGIVHRDLKPGNVLLDAAGEPKVTDFGLAKRGDGDTASHAVMGTIGYMAPEQARGQTKRAGPAADVYALGAVLFRCLAGRTPFEGDDLGELLSRVIEEEPPSVSSVNTAVPRDLSLIVAKCLEKDPARRYPTAAALAADLRRFRAGEPVAARPVGNAERAVKWVRRRPYMAGLIGALAASLLLGTVVSAGLAYWALDQERLAKEQAAEAVRSKHDAEVAAADAGAKTREAEAEAAQANQVTEALADMFRSGDPLTVFTEGLIPPAWEADRQNRRTADDLLRDAATRFRTALKDQPQARGRLLGTAGASFRNLGLLADARPLLSESLALRRQTLPADHREVAEAELELGRLHLESGDYPAALDLCRAAAARLTRIGGHDRQALTARLFEGFAVGMLGKDEAIDIVKEVVAGRDRLDGPTSPPALIAQLALAAVLLELHRPLEAAAVLPDIVRALNAQPPGQLRTLGQTITQFQSGYLMAAAAGTNTFVLGKAEAQFAAADAALAVALPARNIYRAILRFERAQICFKLGKEDECDAHLKECLADVLATCGLAHPKAFLPLRAMAQRLATQNRLGDARALYAQAEDATVARFGGGSPVHTLLLLDQTFYEAEQGQYEAAAALARRALAQADRLPPTRAAWDKAHDAATELRDGPAARVGEPTLALFRLARRLATEADGPDGEGVFLTLRDEADFLRQIGRHREAADALTACEATLAKYKATPEERNVALVYRGRLEADRGDFVAAERAYREATKLSQSFTGNRVKDYVDDLRDLAGALADLNRLGAAEAELEKAAKAAANLKPAVRADVQKQLAAVKRALGKAADGIDWRDAVRAVAGGLAGPKPARQSADAGYPCFGTDWLDRLPTP